MSETDITRCRIGDRYFDTTEEAEEWVGVGNIGGTYSIVYQVYCPDHLDWFDEVYDHLADEHICSKCYEHRQEERAVAQRARLAYEDACRAEQAKLVAWNEGRPI